MDLLKCQKCGKETSTKSPVYLKAKEKHEIPLCIHCGFPFTEDKMSEEIPQEEHQLIKSGIGIIESPPTVAGISDGDDCCSDRGLSSSSENVDNAKKTNLKVIFFVFGILLLFAGYFYYHIKTDITCLAKAGDPEAQYLLALKYTESNDYNMASEWYKKAAEKGLPKAQNNLASLYYHGQGVEKDYKKAFDWYLKAAEKEEANAQYYLGDMYYNGQGVDQDYKKAFEWFLKTAEKGHSKTQCNLGIMYYNGQGVEKDYKKAFDWFLKAAEKGHASAQYNLGIMYEYGHGVKKSYRKAKSWYLKAQEAGQSYTEKISKMDALIDIE